MLRHHFHAITNRGPSLALAIALLALGCATNQSPDQKLEQAADISDPCSLPSPIPLVKISSTSVLPPEDRNKIDAEFRFYETAGPGDWYSPSGPFKSGKGTIHARGQSSLEFPKKSFAINLGKDNAMPIMGMPPSHKWVMIGNWVDTTHLANKMSYDLYAEMGHFGPQSQHVQVCFNDQYWGLYTFGEKVNRDEGRVVTKKASKGGFIIKAVSDGTHFCSETDREYQYEYPDSEKASEEQKRDIRAFVNEYETKVMTRGDWRKYMNEEAETDYFILTEAFVNPDSYFNDKNLFYFKNLENELEPVIWDFIWAFGPPFFVNQGNNPGIWPSIDRGDELMYGNRNYQYQTGYNQFCLMQYYMSDARALTDLKSRYSVWRADLLSNESVRNRWAELVEPLGRAVEPLGLDVYQLDEKRWNNWVYKDWPTERFTPEQIRERLIQRLGVMDDKVLALEVESLSGSCPLSPPRFSCPVQ